jgi:TadE-like protein
MRRPARGQSVVEFALLAPIMIFLLFAILDLARIYTTMMSVESAAREAADFGTSQGAARWLDDTNTQATVTEMKRRACIAASDLPDYQGVDADANGVDEDCTNPSFSYCLRKTAAGACLTPASPGYDCGDPANSDPVADPPCQVTVTMAHVFHLFVPMQMDFFGVQLGLPGTLSFTRDSTFAMTDIGVDEGP